MVSGEVGENFLPCPFCGKERRYGVKENDCLWTGSFAKVRTEFGNQPYSPQGLLVFLLLLSTGANG